MYSDNDTMFVGAEKELFKVYQFALRDPDFLISMDNISWHFIPPFASHFGALWEAGVRSVITCIARSTIILSPSTN